MPGSVSNGKIDRFKQAEIEDIKKGLIPEEVRKRKEERIETDVSGQIDTFVNKFRGSFDERRFKYPTTEYHKMLKRREAHFIQ